MKKLLSIILMGILVLSLAACGGGGGNEGGAGAADFDPAKYEIDVTAEGVQPMSEEKATAAVLGEKASELFGTSTIHSYSDDKKTYSDVVAAIGCDATEFEYRESSGNRMFIWRASDDDSAWFCAELEEADGKWVVATTGSANLEITE